MPRFFPFTIALALLAAAPGFALAKPAPKPAAAPDPFKMPPAPPLPGMDKVPHPIPGVPIETSTEKPRLAIVFKGTPKEFNDQLAKNLEETHRFAVMSPTPQALAAAWAKLGASMSLGDAAKLRTGAKADMAVTCDCKDTGGTLKASARLADLRTGDVSRELAIFGSARDVKVLARTLASYIRESAPLRCYVHEATEDKIVLDLGANDGMRQGTTFRVLRYPQNLQPVLIGTVKLTKLGRFRAEAEVEDARAGLTVSAGDVAVEDTSDLALEESPAPL